MTKREILNNFIVLEGLDGSGTTTQLARLSSILTASGYSCFATCEPTEHPIGLYIRKILRGEAVVTPETLAYLFVADRNEHLFHNKEGITARIGRGEVAISDRYFFSSLAYQGVFCGFDFVNKLNSRFPLPQYLIFLDLSPESCQERLAERAGRDIFDDIDRQYAIYDNYLRSFQIFQESKMQILRIDGELSPEDITERIWSFIQPLPIKEM